MNNFYPKAAYVPSSARGGHLVPDMGVIHYTAGSSLSGARETLAGVGAKTSAHFCIGRDGLVEQYVPCDTQAWHAGVSAWKGRIALNQFSIGIELVNPGWARKGMPSGAGWSTLRARHRNGGAFLDWYTYPIAQIDALCALIEWTGLSVWVGHDHIAPGRKTDPGPAFPWQRISMIPGTVVP